MMRDTHPRAAATYHRLVSEMSPAQRLAQVARLSTGVRVLAQAGIRRRNPGLSERQMARHTAALCYGEEVARRVEHALRERDS